MSVTSENAAFAAFSVHPATYAAPAAVASILGYGISAGFAERLLAQSRLRTRLNAALVKCLGDCAGDLTPAQAAIAGLDPTTLTRLALRAGAVWHAAQIAQAYDGPTVRALVERIGAEFRDVALADIATNPEPRPTQSTADIPLEHLPGAIARDGTASLIAWCETQPRPIGWRILLRLRVNARPDKGHLEAGPAIIERLALAIPA